MFEFDPGKSRSNKAKRGINFLEAQLIWTGETVEIKARSEQETRATVIGMIGLQHWTAIVTRRGKNIRLISVRRARTDEIELYENAKKEDHS